MSFLSVWFDGQVIHFVGWVGFAVGEHAVVDDGERVWRPQWSACAAAPEIRLVFLLAHCALSLFVVDAGGLDFDAGVRLVEGVPPCERVTCAAFAPSSGAYDFVVGLDEVGVQFVDPPVVCVGDGVERVLDEFDEVVDVAGFPVGQPERGRQLYRLVEWRELWVACLEVVADAFFGVFGALGGDAPPAVDAWTRFWYRRAGHVEHDGACAQCGMVRVAHGFAPRVSHGPRSC